MRVSCLCLAAVVMAVGPAAAQQAPDPSAFVRAGTPGVPVPALADPAPAQRRWPLDLALLRTSALEVTLEASVARDGSVEEVRILSPKPPPDQPGPDTPTVGVLLGPPAFVSQDDSLGSSLDDVRAMVLQWRFAPTLVDGVVTPVVVPVRLRLELAPWPEPSFFPERLDPATDTTMPPDFALVYAFGTCELDTRAGAISQTWPARQMSRVIDFELSAAERQTIYAELLRVGFFGYPQLQRGYIARDDTPEILVNRGATELAVTIRGRLSGHAVNTLPSRSLAVLRRGEWKSISWIENDEVNRFVFPPMAGMYAIRTLLDRIVLRGDVAGWECLLFGP